MDKKSRKVDWGRVFAAVLIVGAVGGLVQGRVGLITVVVFTLLGWGVVKGFRKGDAASASDGPE